MRASIRFKEDSKKRSKELINLTFPIMIEQSFIMLMGIINSAMVGVLGYHELSAAGHINNSSQIPTALLAALGTGGTVLVAQAIGAQNIIKAKKAAGQSILLTLFISILVTVLLAIFAIQVVNVLFPGGDYQTIYAAYIYFFYINISIPFLAVGQTIFGVMRGAGDVKTPMFVVIFMNIINIVFSFMLIPILGISGAGLALLVSRVLGCLLALLFIFSKKRTLYLNKISFYLPEKNMQKEIFYLGIPTGIENLLFSIGRTLTLMMVVGLGSYALAANIVILNVMTLFLIPGIAISSSVMVMIGQRVGKGEIEDITKTAIFSIKSCMLVMTLFSLILLPLQSFMANAFNLPYNSIPYFSILYILLLIMSPLFWPIGFITPSALRAVKDVKFNMVVAILIMWIFRVLLSYLLILLGFGPISVWIGFFADWIVRGIAFYLRLIRGKWKINIK